MLKHKMRNFVSKRGLYYTKNNFQWTRVWDTKYHDFQLTDSMDHFWFELPSQLCSVIASGLVFEGAAKHKFDFTCTIICFYKTWNKKHLGDKYVLLFRGDIR